MEHRRKKPSRKAGASLGGDTSSASTFAYRKEYVLLKCRKVEFALDAVSRRIDCLWTPDVPTGKMLRKVWPAYIAARHDFLSGLGEPIVVIDA